MNNQFAGGHEEANRRLIAEQLGPELASQVYRGSAQYDNQGGNNQGGKDYRYAREATQEFNNSGYGQAGQGFGGQTGGQGYGAQMNQVPYNDAQYGSQNYGQPYGGQGNVSNGYQIVGSGTGGSSVGIPVGREWRVSQPQQSFSGYGLDGGGQGGGGASAADGLGGNNPNSSLYSRLPRVMNKAIVAVKKDGRGNILAFKLEDGQVLDYTQMMHASHTFQGLRIQGNREGELIIRSVPDAFTDNNLDNLPTF